MKRYLVIAMIAAAALARAEPPPIMGASDAVHRNLLLQHPPPDYPYEARRRHVTGSGVFLLRFDYETGHLRQVHVAKSTGSAELDSAVVVALKRWQAKPRAVSMLEVPIAFAVGGVR